METLQEIKNNYAQEQGYEDWSQLYEESGRYDETIFFKHEDAIIVLVQKADLEKAAENVTTVHHANQSSDEIEKAVHYTKHSITNPENLIR